MEEKQDELSHKLMYLEMKMEDCVKNSLQESECIGGFKKNAFKVIEEYVKEVQNY